MRDNVLITGGAGFIGLHLARTLVQRGVQVTLVDNFSRGRIDDEVQALLPHVKLVELDLTQPLPHHLDVRAFTQVYHLAAIVGVRTSNEVPHHVLRTNLLTTLNILDWCAQTDTIRLCFASTSEAYAGSVALGLAAVPTPETIPLALPDLKIARASYAASKIVGEQLCLNYARAFHFPLRIVRYHNVYGPRMGYDHVIPQFIQRLLEKQNPFNIFGAWQTRAFCYVDDAVEATLRLMAVPGEEPLTMNVGNDREEIEIEQLAHQLCTIADFHPHLAIHPPPQSSPERRCPDISYLRSLLQYEPQVGLERGLRETYAWYKHAWEQRQHLAA